MPKLYSSLLSFVLLLLITTFSVAAEDSWFERETVWRGYQQFHFKVADRPAYIVAPKEPAQGNPWIWRARFPGYHAEMDIALVGKGFHIGYVDVGGMFGGPQAMKVGDAFYQFAVEKRKLAAKPCLEGVSRGGLFVYHWAVNNPDKVSCIYCDTPVLDFKSWPAGKGMGIGSAPTWKQCQQAYGLDEQAALAYKNNPVDLAEAIAKAQWPILHIVSETDRVVPPNENTYLLQSRLKALGADMEIISVKEGTASSSGHHFTHPQPERVIEFILKHATLAQ